MRIITEQKTVYKFSELADAAKQKAIEIFRNGNDFNDTSECVYEDAATIAELFGLNIRQTRKQRTDKTFHYTPSIYYTGFSSQGDGACFEGTYKYKKGALQAVKDYAPNDTKLHNIVKALQDVQARYFYKLTASTKHSGHYYHSGCMQVTVEHPNDQYRDIIDAEDVVTQSLREYANWIYKQLEDEYDYQNKDTTVAESIKANEYKFLEDGTVYYENNTIK